MSTPRTISNEDSRDPPHKELGLMVILGIILLVLGVLLAIKILFWIGIILLVVGAILFVAGSLGTAVGGRRYWY